MFVDLDVNRQLVPPLGKWRVVEFGPGTSAVNIGPLRRVVGDYDDLPSASLETDRVWWPYTRRQFNDMGAWVSSNTPGPGASPPQAGGES